MVIQSLIERRRQLGISQDDLCHQLGVSAGLVGRWERGVKFPSPFMLMCWAQQLGAREIGLQWQDP